MKEITGNIWDHTEGWIVITTNGTIKYNGEAVMGRGIALQAKQRYPYLPCELGELLQQSGNTVFKFPQYRIYTLPVKWNWWEIADLNLIVTSCKKLAEIVPPNRKVFMVRPGCGAGRLLWYDVRQVIEPILDDRFIVVQKGGNR